MDHYVFSAIVLLLILLGAALGSRVRARLADHHFSEDSLAAMRIAVGLVATLSALVLSLLISSAQFCARAPWGIIASPARATPQASRTSIQISPLGFIVTADRAELRQPGLKAG